MIGHSNSGGLHHLSQSHPQLGHICFPAAVLLGKEKGSRAPSARAVLVVPAAATTDRTWLPDEPSASSSWWSLERLEAGWSCLHGEGVMG